MGIITINIIHRIVVNVGNNSTIPSSTKSCSLMKIVSNSNSPVVITNVLSKLLPMLENGDLIPCVGYMYIVNSKNVA